MTLFAPLLSVLWPFRELIAATSGDRLRPTRALEGRLDDRAEASEREAPRLLAMMERRR
jgi:hypothetical protein